MGSRSILCRLIKPVLTTGKVELAIVLALALSGCAQPPPLTPCDMAFTTNTQAASEYAAVPVGAQPAGSVGRRGVKIIDDTIVSAILIDDVATGRRANGSAEVAVRLLNCTASQIQLDVATQFTDQAGFSAEPVSIWKRMFLPPRTSRVYEELSTGNRPAYVMIEIRGGL